MIINPNTSESMTDQIRRELERIKRKETEILVTCPEEGPVAIESNYDQAFAIPPTLKLVERANREGFDAVIIAAFCDPGLDAAKEISNILVLGIQEVTLHIAAMLGARFTVLTMTEEHVPKKYREARHYMMEQPLASVRPLGLTVTETNADPVRTKKQVMQVARQAAEEDGAEVIILGCAGMVGYAQEVAKDLGVTVLDPTTLTLKICESMIEAGVTHSKRALFARPSMKEFKKIGEGRG
jgi:allantoin racemase